MPVRAAEEKKRLEERKLFGPIDYDSPPKPDAETVSLPVKVSSPKCTEVMHYMHIFLSVYLPAHASACAEFFMLIHQHIEYLHISMHSIHKYIQTCLQSCMLFVYMCMSTYSVFDESFCPTWRAMSTT
jgi:hypothetical protein